MTSNISPYKIDYSSPSINHSKASLQIDWQWLDNLDVEIGSKAFAKCSLIGIKGLPFTCALADEAYSLENRKEYIKHVVEDVNAKCPKDQPLTLVCYGADNLFMEYLIAKALIMLGFINLYFIMIDLTFKYSENTK